VGDRVRRVRVDRRVHQNYSAMPGCDQVIPRRLHPRLPAAPQQVLDALILLMDRIQTGRGHSQLRTKQARSSLPRTRSSEMSKQVLEALTAKHAHAIERTESAHGDEIAWIKRDDLVHVATFLRDDRDGVRLADLLHGDRPARLHPISNPSAPIGAGATPPWTEDQPRFEVCYQLRSIKHRHRIRLKIGLPEHDPSVPSLAEIWPAFQLAGARDVRHVRHQVYDGHPDLRRIYMYEEFVGYPLRKDYPKEKRQPLVRPR